MKRNHVSSRMRNSNLQKTDLTPLLDPPFLQNINCFYFKFFKRSVIHAFVCSLC